MLIKKFDKYNLLLCFLFLCGILLRLSYLKAPYIDSDQAVFGLQGLHVLKGEFPVFSWGYSYIGTISSYLDAVLFKIFGISRQVLNGATLIFYIIYLLATFRIAISLFGNGFLTFVTMALAFLSPEFFLKHSIWARHGYPETYAFGSLLISWAAGNMKNKKLSPALFFLIGFIAGLGWWSNFLIIYYFVPLAVFLLYHFYCHYSDRGYSVRTASLLLISFFMGSLPFWLYNFTNDFSSFSMFSYSSTGGGSRNIFKAIVMFIKFQFPVLIGADSYDNFKPGIFSLLLSITWGVFCIFPLLYSARRIKKLKRSWRPEADDLISIFLIVIAFLFFKSSYADGKDMSTIRYLVPFYSIYPLLPGLFLKRYQQAERFRYLVWAALLFSVFMNLAAVYKASPWFSERVYNNYKAVKLKENKIFEQFDARNLKSAFMYDYWSAPLFTFDAKEKYIFAHVNSRYSPYIDGILAAEKVNYLVSGNIKAFENGINSLGYTAKSEELVGYDLYAGFSKKVPNYHFLPAKFFRVHKPGSIRELTVLNDNNLSSFLAVNQNGKKDLLNIHLREEEKVVGLGITLYDRFKAPGRVMVRSENRSILDTSEFLPGFRAAGYPYIPASPEYFELYFTPVTAKKLEIEMESFIARSAIAIKEITVIVEKDYSFQPDISLQDLKKIINSEDHNLKASVGGRAFYRSLHESLKGPLEKAVRKECSFRDNTLLIFEKEALIHNMNFLRKSNIKFKYGLNSNFAWINTEKSDWKTAVWSGKQLFREVNRNKSRYFYRKAKKAAYSRDDEAAAYFQKTLYYTPCHYPSLAYLEDYWRRNKVKKELKKITTFIDRQLTPAKRVLAKFFNTIAIDGIDMPAEVAKGKQYPYRLYFNILKEKKNQFAVFVHFKDPQGNLLFQDDHYLENGDLEQSFIEGEIIRDVRVFSVPADLKYQGVAEVWFGLWDPETGKRFKPDFSENLLQEKDNLFSFVLKANSDKSGNKNNSFKSRERSIKLTEIKIT